MIELPQEYPMNALELLIREAQTASEQTLVETLKYLRSLKAENQAEKCDATKALVLLSESSLAKDWLSPEEEEAWQYLTEQTA
jgi:hypothetical protein